jgi:tetratricopeptide (TPR) repeat protein
VSSLATQAEGVAYLLGQLVRLDRLNADPALPVLSAFTARSAIAAVALGGILALGLAWIRRRPAAAFGILWTFVWLAPTNSVVPRLDVANDRQLYLAIAGPAWLLAWGAFRALREPRSILVGAALLSGVLGIATVRRNGVYADETTFWRDVTAKSPANGRAWNNLGWAQALAGRDGEAEASFLQALALDGGDVRAAVNLKLLREGKLPRPPHFSQE